MCVRSQLHPYRLQLHVAWLNLHGHNSTWMTTTVYTQKHLSSHSAVKKIPGIFRIDVTKLLLPDISTKFSLYKSPLVSSSSIFCQQCELCSLREQVKHCTTVLTHTYQVLVDNII